jgi:hypothetical protein
MTPLPTELVSKACRVFFESAYPGGIETVPAQKRFLLDLPPGLAMLQFATTGPAALTCCQIVDGKTGGPRALLIRLGCTHYPHLKLKVQRLDGPPQQPSDWLFSVDTHDAFSPAHFFPPPDHPEAAAWKTIQSANAALKEKIESAWHQAGILTFNGLLRRELQ